MSHELIIDRNCFSIFRCLWPEEHGQSNYRGSMLDSYVRIIPLIWSVLWISSATSVHPGNLILPIFQRLTKCKNDWVTIDSALFHTVQSYWFSTQSKPGINNGKFSLDPDHVLILPSFFYIRMVQFSYSTVFSLNKTIYILL